nr:MAG TPA: hypothetical protein [Caudoviricetes sp.]
MSFLMCQKDGGRVPTESPPSFELMQSKQTNE